MNEYQRKCLTTESRQWNHPDEGLLHAAFGLMTETVELLDFNSQKNFLEELGDICWYVAIGASHLDLTLSDLDELDEVIDPEDDLLHLLVVEAAEIVDQLKKSIFYGRVIDLRKIAGGLARILSTVECLAFEMESDLEDVMHKNILKLQKRFPHGVFTSDDANNRDVNTEMSVY